MNKKWVELAAVGAAFVYVIVSVMMFAGDVRAAEPSVEPGAFHIAIVAAFVTIVTPLLTVFASSYSRRSDRAEDRKDRAEAAKLLVESNATIAAHVTKVAEVAEKADERTNNQLKQIHTLVNSNLTNEMRGRLRATQRDLASMQENVRLTIALRLEPMQELLTAIESTKQEIVEVSAALMERETTAQIVAKEQAANPAEQK